MKYAWVAKHKAVWPVAVSCRVLDLSIGGFYGVERPLFQAAKAPSLRVNGSRISDETLLIRIQ